MANTFHRFALRSVCSSFLLFLLHVLLINASPIASVPTKQNELSFPTFDQSFQGRVEKGQYLKKLFPLDEEEATQFNGGVTVASRFKDPSVLKANGWTRYIYWFPYEKNTGDRPPRFKFLTPTPKGLDLEIPKQPTYGHDLNNAFADTDHPVDKTKAGVYHYRHDRRFGTLKNKKPTFASNANVLVPASSAIIFDDDTSPEAMKKYWKLGSVPELHRVSDIAFFQWMDACKAQNVNPKSLKLIIVFSMDSRQGQAILGSTWGSALSWMLIQHKKELGLKKITKVAVWGAKLGFPLPLSHGMVGTMEMKFIVEDA
ncbi:hypothetical protein CSUB01_07897 [Colletotrichum sublineola]|uniref:Uncharacterized protein n=1 Tax=Colletotrichum sublineola TaxID=1173701 RepID=A0A066XB77_COLSU|nr:hypothetical protein CSUB01_07897 [Colletotrichum sublineola]